MSVAFRHQRPIYAARPELEARDEPKRPFYSEDLNHGQRYGDVTVINPFRSVSH